MIKTPLTLDVFIIMDTVARRQSFAKAAEELNKAPSAISYAVQKLEDQLGITIYERQGRRSVLTPAGELLLKNGRDILLSTHNLALQAKQVATGWEPTLRIAVESLYALPDFFNRVDTFLKSHPYIECDIQEAVLNGGWERLLNNDVDILIGATTQAPQHSGLRVVNIGEVSLKLVAATHHAKIKNIQASPHAAINELRHIITHDNAQTYITKSAGLIDGKQHCYVQTMQQKIEAIKAGVGIGHLPSHCADLLIERGEVIDISIKPKIHAIFLAYKLKNKGKALHAFSQLFL